MYKKVGSLQISRLFLLVNYGFSNRPFCQKLNSVLKLIFLDLRTFSSQKHDFKNWVVVFKQPIKTGLFCQDPNFPI